jgi:deoxyxylulose-5-phosphate synthase
VIAAPKDGDEFIDLIYFVRYPRGTIPRPLTGKNPEILEIGKWEVLLKGEDILFLPVGYL